MPLRVITCNVNGIRSAARKNFWPWVEAQNADFICLQEMRAHEKDFPKELVDHHTLKGYFNIAERPGYSGVGIYTPHKPKAVKTSFGWPDIDNEGRFIELDYANVRIISIYFPSGSHSEDRQKLKYVFLEKLEPYLEKLKQAKKHVIVCGDVNIAHKNIDIKNWKGNLKNSGFLPEERAWMDKIFASIGFVDAFRIVNQEADQYTWWSNRGQAYAKNVGWRIDYQIVTPSLSDKIERVAIFKDVKFSDHAPLTIDYNIKL